MDMEHSGFEFVDLGLPSGTKWAKCNVGANNPWDYGDYFQWGSVKPDTDKECTWSTAPFNDGNEDYDEDAFKAVKDTVCPNGILAPEYDAAHINMGGDWHMPTDTDFRDLVDNTTNKRVEDYKGTGVNGILFVSKVNDNTLFIPAAGYRLESSFDGVGDFSDVWSSSINLYSLCEAIDLNEEGMDGYERYFGFSVRGVFNSK